MSSDVCNSTMFFDWFPENFELDLPLVFPLFVLIWFLVSLRLPNIEVFKWTRFITQLSVMMSRFYWMLLLYFHSIGVPIGCWYLLVKWDAGVENIVVWKTVSGNTFSEYQPLISYDHLQTQVYFACKDFNDGVWWKNDQLEVLYKEGNPYWFEILHNVIMNFLSYDCTVLYQICVTSDIRSLVDRCHRNSYFL